MKLNSIRQTNIKLRAEKAEISWKDVIRAIPVVCVKLADSAQLTTVSETAMLFMDLSLREGPTCSVLTYPILLQTLIQLILIIESLSMCPGAARNPLFSLRNPLLVFEEVLKSS